MMKVVGHVNGRVRVLRGMTLFETMVVLTIVSILAVFFFLSSRYLVVQTKISRVKEEHKVLVRALQNYQMDYYDFPNNEQGLSALNSPTAYLSSLPIDPFRLGLRQIYYYHHNPGGGYRYIIVSSGPDGDIDFLNYLQEAMLVPSADPERSDEPDRSITDALFSDYLTQRIYDPTNGLNSDGDVITLSYR